MCLIKFFKRYGLFVILVSLGIVILILSIVFRTDGNSVIISIDGNDTIELSLSEDITYQIDEYGHNTLIIKDNMAWIEDSDCPDKLCMNYGKISKTGDSIICLPHRLVIRIENNNYTEDLDAIAK